MRHPDAAHPLNFQFVLQNLMICGLGEVEVTCQLTNREVWIVFNSCSNSVNVDLYYRGAFSSTVLWIQNGQLAIFFKLTVPPKICSLSEQSISMPDFYSIECLHSHQATSNTILHNKPLLHSSLPWWSILSIHSDRRTKRRIFYTLNCNSMNISLIKLHEHSVDVETNKFFNGTINVR